MKYTLILLTVLFVGCEKVSFVERTTPYCLEEKDRDKLAKFVVDCSTAANPKSDEEGEDLVAQCEKMGVASICPMTKMCRYEGRGWSGVWTTCDEAKVISSKI